MIKRLKNMYKLYKAAKFSCVNHTLTDENRQESIAVRGLKKQLQTMEEINARQEELIKTLSIQANAQGGSFEEKLFSQMLPILAAKLSTEQKPTITQQPKQEQQETLKTNYTDEEIKTLINQNPNLKVHSVNFTDEEIEKYLNTQIPNIEKDCTERIIKQIRQ